MTSWDDISMLIIDIPDASQQKSISPQCPDAL